MSTSQKVKSPFLVFQDFLADDDCDKIAADVRVVPTKDQDGIPQSMLRYHEAAEKEIFPKFQKLIPQIEKHYDLKYKGTEHLVFQQFPVTNKPAEEPHCESAVFKRKKWIKVRDRDLTGILWLKNFQDQPPFNLEKEVLGGKLEFPVYQFGFQPQKGTLVVYPAGERFISLTTPILVGELQCVRFHIAADGIWIYQPGNFPGDYRTWFTQIV
jgi:hypothetical protein